MAAAIILSSMVFLVIVGYSVRVYEQSKMRPRAATVVEKIHNIPNAVYEPRLSRDDDGVLAIELNKVRREESWCLVVVDDEGTVWNVFVNRYEFEITNVLDSCTVSYYDR